MKKSTIISAIILALIITGINTGFAKNNGKSNVNTAVKVKYQVTVNLDISRPLCNLYQVEVLDAAGRQVAPPQAFVEGTQAYIFEEQTRQTVGIRIARIVTVSWGDHFVCDQEMFTTPAVRLINFTDRQVYLFNLSPSFKKPK
jgi:hypothetical protein